MFSEVNRRHTWFWWKDERTTRLTRRTTEQTQNTYIILSENLPHSWRPFNYSQKLANVKRKQKIYARTIPRLGLATTSPSPSNHSFLSRQLARNCPSLMTPVDSTVFTTNRQWPLSWASRNKLTLRYCFITTYISIILPGSPSSSKRSHRARLFD
jgi:hypothetical protein